MIRFSTQDVCVIRRQRMIARNIRFSLAAGDVLTVIGANGSGKSSLLRILAGLSRGYPGEVSWEGRSIAGREESHRRRVAYLAHADAMKPTLSAGRNLEMWSALDGSAAVEEKTPWPGDLPLGFLSAGQQRRAALERIFRRSCPLWILDEPHTHLDPPSIAALHDAIRRHGQGGGITVLCAQTRLPSLGGKTFALT